MSRVAKAPISVPTGVQVTQNLGVVHVKGPKGSIEQKFHPSVKITLSADADAAQQQVVTVSPDNMQKPQWSHAGTVRAILNNMITGVTSGFVKKLDLVGVGYRAQSISPTKLNLSLGFSHPVVFDLPAGVTCETPTVTNIVLSSIDKQLLGEVASKIRAFRPPEPYKGKGIRYTGETILRKEAKKK